MEPSLFAYIWRHSRAQQLAVVAVVLGSLPFYFLSLNLPALIVNGPIQGQGFETPGATQTFLALSLELFGLSLPLFPGVPLERVPMLFALSTLFLALVCANGLFKFQVNTMKGRMGERLLRRLRHELVDRMLRFPLGHFRRVRQAEVASMVKDEVEPIGGFIGDAYAVPLFMGGQAATAMAFILIQSFWLGLIAAAVVFAQAFLIPRLRRPILALGRQRQLQARDLAGRVAEIVDGLADIRAHGTTNFERADVTRRLGEIFFIRFELYQRKFFVKFLNNFLAQVTPFIFYALGGYFAIRGELSVGELVAVIAAYKDLPAPIKELIDWDLQRQDAQIKYEQVIEQFHPDGMLAATLQAPLASPPDALHGRISVRDATVLDESGARLLDGAQFDLPLDGHTAFGGPPGQGKEAAAQLLARLIVPKSGRVRLGAVDLAEAPEDLIGRRVGYVGPDAYLFPGSVADNILYGLKHAPLRPGARHYQPHELREIAASGNAPFDPHADWVDLDAAGAADAAALPARLIALLPLAGFDTDVHDFALRSLISPEVAPALTETVLAARVALRARLKAAGLEGLVAPFDESAFNRNATIGENLLFGTPRRADFEGAALARQRAVRAVLAAHGLDLTLAAAGRLIAETMVELFRDLPGDHPFFEQFSFLSAAELPLYQQVLSRTAALAPEAVGLEDRDRLVALSFRYVDARHRLGLVDAALRAGIVAARAELRTRLAREAPDAVAFHDPEAYNPAATLKDNILFGRVAYGAADAERLIAAEINGVLEALGLIPEVLAAGLRFEAGSAGRRLTPAQRQKIALLRALVKSPDLLIVNQGLAVLDPQAQSEIMGRVLKARAGRGVVWVLPRADGAAGFSRLIVFEHGRVADDRALSPPAGAAAPAFGVRAT